MKKPYRIAILASGSGTNAENIVKMFKADKSIDIVSIGSNKKSAFVLERAKKLGVDHFTFNKEEMKADLIKKFQEIKIDFVVLAGFLLKLPVEFIRAFQDRIINIHPALLPQYGGKGMYGDYVHKAVIENKDEFSGITIHLVNENYDEGRILFQAMCQIEETDTPETLAKKVHKLEYEYYPKIILDYIREYQD